MTSSVHDQLLDLKDVECPFLWQPENGSTKTNVGQVMERIHLHLHAEPRFSVAYLTALSYLATLPPFPNFAMAEQHLKQAEDISRDESGGTVRLRCRFITIAMRLRIRQITRGRPFRPQEIANEMAELTALWDSGGATRAAVYAIKGMTLRFFGPKKYSEGAAAFQRALELEPDNFHWLWGQAYLLARCDRQQKAAVTAESHPTLWRSAREIAEQDGIGNPVFYANYAEAVMVNRMLCEELMDLAVRYLLNLEPEEREKHAIVFIIGLKLYRHLRRFIKYNNLLKLARSIEKCCKDSGFYLEMFRHYNREGDRERALEALRNGKQCAMHPGHIWIDLTLIEFEADEVGKENTLRAFDSLCASNYNVYDRSVGVIRLRKACFLLTHGDLQDGMDECLLAIETFPDAAGNLEDYRIKQMLLAIKGWSEHEEYEAWFMSNMSSTPEEQVSMRDFCRMEDMYHKALVRDRRNGFAWKHLGKLYLKQKHYQLAVDCFRQLSNEEDSAVKDDLLADALVGDPDAKLDSIEECIRLGCWEACPKIFKLLADVKSDLAARVLAMVDADSSVRESSLLFFSRRVYELCAMVQIRMDTLDVGQSSLAIDMQQSIRDLLELGSLTTASATNECDRGNLMRVARLELTKIYLQGQEKTEKFYNQVIPTLKEAKEWLDRSFANQFASSGTSQFAYIHAFDRMKLLLMSDPEYNRNLKQQRTPADRKAFEARELIKAIRQRPDLRSLACVKDQLSNSLKGVDPNFCSSKKTQQKFEFLAMREHRILEQENRWILRWIHPVNTEKHKTEILVRELEAGLVSDWSGWDGCRTAYELAHLAAEFAEETWLVLGPDRTG